MRLSYFPSNLRGSGFLAITPIPISVIETIHSCIPIYLYFFCWRFLPNGHCSLNLSSLIPWIPFLVIAHDRPTSSSKNWNYQGNPYIFGLKMLEEFFFFFFFTGGAPALGSPHVYPPLFSRVNKLENFDPMQRFWPYCFSSTLGWVLEAGLISWNNCLYI